jgi:hypothetical protein
MQVTVILFRAKIEMDPEYANAPGIDRIAQGHLSSPSLPRPFLLPAGLYFRQLIVSLLQV